jgi:fumarate hydratase class I
MTELLTELIRRTTSMLPEDIEQALRTAASQEEPGSQAALFLNAILANIAMAREQSIPLCQDTGTLTFFWKVPRRTDTLALEEAAKEAVKIATQKGWLRQNTIETLSGKSIATNVCAGAPVNHFEQHASDDLEVWLMQKGGGSENMSLQFSLPDSECGAGRDLAGVRTCLLHAAWKAQGFGCAPGILGVCIGADRGEGFLHAKQQLLRPLTDTNPDPDLAALETRCLNEINQLNIGPMGMGGKTTLLGVKINAAPRLPASYFVTVAYMCWVCRRRGLRLSNAVPTWLG